jgi:WD40 repeat protein
MRVRLAMCVAAVCLSSLGNALAVDLNQLKLLEAIPFQSAGDYITGVTFSPDETHTLSVDSQFRVSLWNVADGERVWTWTLQDTGTQEKPRVITSASFSASKIVRLELTTFEIIELDAMTGKPLGAPKPWPAKAINYLAEAVNRSGTLIARVQAAPQQPPDAALLTDDLLKREFERLQLERQQPTGEIVLTDAHTKREVGRLKELHGAVVKLSFSPDGLTLAAARNDGRISLWDVNTKTKRWNLRGNSTQDAGTILNLSWSADSSLILTQDLSVQIVWDANTGQIINRVPNEPMWGQSVYQSDLSPSGRLMALGLTSGAIDLVDARTGSRLKRIGFKLEKAVYSKDSSSLYATAIDGRVRVFKRTPNGYALENEFDLGGTISDLTLLEDRGLLIVTVLAVKNLAVYDVRSRTISRYRILNGSSFVRVTALPDSNRLRFFSSEDVILDLTTGEQEPVDSVERQCDGALSPSFDLIVKAQNNTISVCQLEDSKILWSRPWPYQENLFWSTSQRLLASSVLESRIAVLDAQTGATRAVLKAPYTGKPDEKPGLSNMVFSPDDALLVVRYNDNTVRYFNLKTSTEWIAPPALRQALEVSFTPDGHAMVVHTLEGLTFWGLPDRAAFKP